MYKFIFSLVTDPLGLPIHFIWEYLILLVINKLAFKIAWEVSPGGIFGSEIHWLVRLISFVILWAILRAIIVVINFVIANWVIFVCSGIIAVTAVIVVSLEMLRRRKQGHA